MKRTCSILFAALFVALPLASAQAQTRIATAGPSVPREDWSRDIPAEMWEAKPCGNYDIILDSPDHVSRVRITVSETGEKLIALFWPEGDIEGQSMNVTVAGTDLVLNARTRRGPLEVNIERRGQKLTGYWTLGTIHGAVKGEVTS